MKRQGCSILFVNEQRQVLLFLRDDLPHIPYPNTWDVPGGHVEEAETPAQCIVREMKEEMGLDLEGFELFSVKEFSDRIEHTFWKSANLHLHEISLQEGQRLRWFSEQEARATLLAYGFKEIVAEFYAKAPFLGR
jgi:8-oxo-dGTP diphosphatase